MRWLSRYKLSKVSTFDKLFKIQKPKIGFFKKILLFFLNKEIDLLVAYKIKALTDHVNEFIRPVNVLASSLYDCKGLIVYRDNGVFQGYILSDMSIRAVLKNNPNIQKKISSDNLKEIFARSSVTDDDLASSLMRQSELQVGKDVPADVADMFADALSGKYD